MKIILASHNDHKVNELNTITQDHSVSFESLRDIGWHNEIIEDGETIADNAWIKAETIWKAKTEPVLAEDTGLLIDALNGEPGVHTARYAGDERNNSKNMDLVLSKLKGKDKRTARFKTVIALIIDDERHQFTGICEGKIAYIKSGQKGFGYDPIFIPEGYDSSFAELSVSVKNSISHRARAVQSMMIYLSSRK